MKKPKGYRGGDAAKSDRASGRNAGRADERGAVDRSAVGPGSEFSKNQNKQVTVKSGPKYVNPRPFGIVTPISYQIGATTLNLAKKSMYNKKNLVEQKKVDVLGGEMLTQGKTGPKIVRNDNQGNSRIKPIIPTSAISTTKPIDKSLIKPKDNFFNFVPYKVGGLSGGVSYGPPPKRGPNPQVPPIKMKRGGHK
tara:strand:- start:1940 stop:2521 length:582 start_codon:yes stop_codon:yes gene_type:complete